MEIAPQSLEGLVVRVDRPAGEPQTLRRLANPATGDGLFFRIIVVRGKMLPKVGRTIV
jgi:hypothetical protein